MTLVTPAATQNILKEIESKTGVELKSMKPLIVILLFIEVTLKSFGQEYKPKDSLGISFHMAYSNIYKTIPLVLNVVYQNTSDKEVEIYDTLDEGDRADRFFNIWIEMEKQQGKIYKINTLRFYTNARTYQLDNGSLRHFDLPKRKLGIGKSDTITLNLLNVAKHFYPGKYRFRAHLRVRTIKNETEYSDKTGELPPPLDDIEYLISQWIYFEVKEKIELPIVK